MFFWGLQKTRENEKPGNTLDYRVLPKLYLEDEFGIGLALDWVRNFFSLRLIIRREASRL